MNRNSFIFITLYLILSNSVHAQPFPSNQDSQLAQQVEQLRSIVLEQDSRLVQQQQEIQALRGDNEVLSHKLEQVKQQQQDIYLDIDQRLRQLQEGISLDKGESEDATPGVDGMATSEESITDSTQPTPSLTESSPPSSAMDSTETPAMEGDESLSNKSTATDKQPEGAEEPEQEKKLYQNAFKQLQDKSYGNAIEGFNVFLSNYPKGEFADNAQYWLGESYYANKQFNEALLAFQKLVSQYPDSPKRAHAELKIGYVHYELKDYASAKTALEGVVQNYPGTAAARLAEQRLSKIE